MKNNAENMTFGVIVGNRDFFPDKLVSECKADLKTAFEKAGISPVMLDELDSKLGGVESFADAQKCAALFRKHADTIMGVIVVLPNFGDEKASQKPSNFHGWTSRSSSRPIPTN